MLKIIIRFISIIAIIITKCIFDLGLMAGILILKEKLCTTVLISMLISVLLIYLLIVKYNRIKTLFYKVHYSFYFAYITIIFFIYGYVSLSYFDINYTRYTFVKMFLLNISIVSIIYLIFRRYFKFNKQNIIIFIFFSLFSVPVTSAVNINYTVETIETFNTTITDKHISNKSKDGKGYYINVDNSEVPELDNEFSCSSNDYNHAKINDQVTIIYKRGLLRFSFYEISFK